MQQRSTTSDPRTRLLICPRCRVAALDRPQRAGESRVVCASCSAAYPIRDGVIDLIPDLNYGRGLAQRTMESDLVVRIYESRLWRRSFIATLALGISFAREQELVLRALNPPRDGAVLDLACGPGIYTRPLARSMPEGTVVGLDLSLPMLRYAQRRAESERLRNVVFVRASALDLPLQSDGFDGANCCGALHLFPDAAQALREVARVLEAGGSFTAAVFRDPIRGRAGKAASAERTGAIGIHAFRTGELEQLLEDAGFEAVTCLHRSLRWLVVSARKRG